jgi:hypothetical protein
MQPVRHQLILNWVPTLALATALFVPASHAHAQLRRGGISRPTPTHRPSGGGSAFRAPSYSRPSYSRPSYSRPSYSRPTYHPSVGNYGHMPQVRPAPTYHPGAISHGPGVQVRPSNNYHAGTVAHGPGVQGRPSTGYRPEALGRSRGSRRAAKPTSSRGIDPRSRASPSNGNRHLQRPEVCTRVCTKHRQAGANGESR